MHAVGDEGGAADSPRPPRENDIMWIIGVAEQEAKGAALDLDATCPSAIRDARMLEPISE